MSEPGLGRSTRQWLAQHVPVTVRRSHAKLAHALRLVGGGFQNLSANFDGPVVEGLDVADAHDVRVSHPRTSRYQAADRSKSCTARTGLEFPEVEGRVVWFWGSPRGVGLSRHSFACRTHTLVTYPLVALRLMEPSTDGRGEEDRANGKSCRRLSMSGWFDPGLADALNEGW